MYSFLNLKTVLMMILLLTLSTTLFSSEASGPKAPAELKCEYLKDPMGLDVKEPRLFWVPLHTDRVQKQTAYQILVSTSPDAAEGDMWDSNKVKSAQSIQVKYAGQDLESNRTYYWKVRYWDSYDEPSPYSQIARFDTGIFPDETWEAEWITKYNQLRKEFEIEGQITRARTYISGLGYYELRINGSIVGDSVLDPAWTTYDRRVLYSTYDVTDILIPGINAVGVTLGAGWYKSRALIFQMHIELEGGEEIIISSDKTWKSKQGPIISDSIYDGETYDARMECPGWSTPGYDESGWETVDSAITPRGSLIAQLIQPVRVVDTIFPIEVTNPEPGVYIYDMGQNFSGWVQLKVKGPSGTQIRMRFAELLYKSGSINQENLRKARAEDIYILKGGPEETYEPRFTYHGFRYVELTGFPGVPTLETIRGRVAHTDVEQTGGFLCSKQILNQLQSNILWGLKTNLHGIPTDCNQRDERMGWLGDAHLTAEVAMMNFDIGAFYTKFIRDISDVQDNKGTLTDTVPYVWGSRPADPAWGTAYPLLCWYMYRYYDDKEILDEQYEGLKKYTDFLCDNAKGKLVTYSHYGDWVSVDKTPGSLVSAFFYYYDVLLMSQIAEVLGKSNDAKDYRQLADKIKGEFHKTFFNTKTGGYGTNSQTSNVLPLFLEMVPESVRGGVTQNLIQDILYKNNTHLTTGIHGTKYLMELLNKLGSDPLAYELATQTTYPSWGYMIENGATTLWELWQNKTGPGMNSHNHPMFGSVGGWFYKALAGIDQKAGSTAFSQLIIQPRIVRDLTHASGSIQTIRGRVSTNWYRKDNELYLAVEIPVNCEAEIILPKLNFKNCILSESDVPLYSFGRFRTGIIGISMVDELRDTLVIKASSGRYSFKLTGQ
ncbi:family 78 glycoside hydrolase catalytic domain [Acidobacteriota bacterium]